MLSHWELNGGIERNEPCWNPLEPNPPTPESWRLSRRRWASRRWPKLRLSFSSCRSDRDNSEVRECSFLLRSRDLTKWLMTTSTEWKSWAIDSTLRSGEEVDAIDDTDRAADRSNVARISDIFASELKWGCVRFNVLKPTAGSSTGRVKAREKASAIFEAVSFTSLSLGFLNIDCFVFIFTFWWWRWGFRSSAQFRLTLFFFHHDGAITI